MILTVVQVPKSLVDKFRRRPQSFFSEDPQDCPQQASAAENDYIKERGERAVATLAKGFRSAGLEPELSYVGSHDLAGAIVTEAENMKADLIVMGATRQLFQPEVWSSVTARVSQECERPLLLMPTQPREERLMGEEGSTTHE